jgi:hypothetical protein
LRTFAITEAPCCLKSVASASRKSLLNDLRVASNDDYKFHKDLIDFQGNEIISKHYSLNAARVRLFRINIGEPLQRLDVAAKEHLEVRSPLADSRISLKRGNPPPLPRSLNAPVFCVYWKLESEPIFPLA